MQRMLHIGRLCAKTSIFFYALLWLMVLLVAGTVAQRDLGLYQAQQIYFSSWIYWLWFLPLPGGSLTLSLIFVNLLARLLFTTKWIWQRTGTIITHMGAMLILVGSGLTALYSTEGALVLEEGEQGAVVRDYHLLELVVTKTSDPEHDEVTTFARGWLKPGEQIMGDLPFIIDVQKFHINTRPEPRLTPAPEQATGFYKMFDLQELPRAKQNEENQAGVVFGVRENMKAPSGSMGVYAVFERMTIPQTMTASNGDEYRVEIRRVQRRLPFDVKLIDFKQETYPGTQMAESYSSVVEVIDGDVTQRSVIAMNHPLRHKGYTLFQASFIEGRANETSVFAVVHNVGRLFPYISSIIMCIGLLIHLLIQVPLRMRKGGA